MRNERSEKSNSLPCADFLYFVHVYPCETITFPSHVKRLKRPAKEREEPLVISCRIRSVFGHGIAAAQRIQLSWSVRNSMLNSQSLVALHLAVLHDR